jgi:hypothetical protein
MPEQPKTIFEMDDAEFLTYVSQFQDAKRKRLIEERQTQLNQIKESEDE